MSYAPPPYQASATWRRGCVHPDTLLETPDGPCPIRKWRGGEIYSYKDGERITTYATPSVEGTEEDLYQVEISNGRKVICTDEHKFKTFDGWKMLKELSVMDPYVLSQCYDSEVAQFYRVLNVVKVGREKYWDLHVPETNCYFAQGILHHNSGKSSLLFGKVLQHIEKNRGKSKMIFFRENFDDLADLIDKGKDILEANGLADYISGQTKTFRFKGPFEGAWLKMRQIEHIDQLKKFKGHEYTLIGFDEICDFNLPFETINDTFMATLRNPHGIKSQIIYTGNPGGYNHTAVKKYFIDPWPAGNRIIENEFGQQRAFFQSTVRDNPYLLKDETYIRQLERIKDPMMRKAWLNGDWNVALGAMFSDVWEPKKHIVPYTITPQDIPQHFDRYRCFDWGSSHPFAYLRYFVSTGEDLKNGKGNFPPGSVVFYNEYYGWQPGNKVNEGLKMSSSEVAKEIRRREVADGDNLWLQPGPADNQIYAGIDGNPIYAAFYAEGVKFVESIKSAGSIATGCELIRNRLVGDGDRPQMYVTKDCVHTIRTLPTLNRHKIHTERLADYQEDHCLVAGTMIPVKANGVEVAVRIEDVKTGDQVKTRAGYRRVTEAFKTAEDTTVYQSVSDAGKLEGTRYHPVFTLNRGWVALGFIVKGDLLVKEDTWAQKLLNLTGSGLGDTLNPNDLAIKIISNLQPNINAQGLKHFTERSGSTTTGLFQKAVTSITSTVILAIMTFPTLILWMAASTCLITARVLKGRLSSEKTSSSQSQRLLNGTDQLRAESGTENTEKKRGRTGSLLIVNALTAEKLLKLCSSVAITTSVLEHVRLPFVAQVASMMKTVSVWYVRKLLSSTDTRRGKRAVAIAKGGSCQLSKTEAVYNLEVEGLHEYYANGVLVHNCVDALRYGILALNSLKKPATAATIRKEMTSREKFLQEMMSDE